MTKRYHEGQREFQDRFDTRRLADRLAESTSDTFDENLAAFIESRDMFFIASTDTDGSPDCSYKGGDPGFVRVIDERTLAFPIYDGNGMFRTLGNLSVNAPVGLLFIDFETGNRLRVNGDANIDVDNPLMTSYQGALCVVQVRARSIFANCRRYVHQYQKVSPSPSYRATMSTLPFQTGNSTPGSTERFLPTTRRTIRNIRVLPPCHDLQRGSSKPRFDLAASGRRCELLR